LIAQKDAKCETLPAYWRGLLKDNSLLKNPSMPPRGSSNASFLQYLSSV
jgi:hypothetical protein